MKIKRFFAPNVRSAMRMVKDELGEDAVILSNKRVNGGIEIISAIDYDENALRREVQQEHAPEPPVVVRSVDDMTQQPQQPYFEQGQQPDASNNNRVKDIHQKKLQVTWSQEPTLMEMRGEMKTMRGLLETQLAELALKDQQLSRPFEYELKQRMARLGLGASLAAELLQSLPKEGVVDDLWRRLLGKIAVKLSVTDDDILTQGGAVALIGPTGVGKTTTVAKLAARFVMRHGTRSVALISTDNFRIGAHEQLKAYARILDVPIRFANSAETLQTALDHFCDKRLVLIDTAGMSQRDLRLTEQFSVLQDESDRVRTYLVASTTSRLSGLQEVVQGFKGVELSGCILTKVDESTCLGHALDVVIQQQLPVAYISDGQRVPEDLQPARAHTLVSRSVAIMQESTDLLEDELITGVQVAEVGS
ncbi:MAG TPA: flagellar biosynthesis protein FlhF [Candidatus Tenderia electrophaga]|uniref:Flagellar biosynthesis protein FlhF n=1 Tax=Candidatus Tenderia electrophaga TaxID=1748243 RepID=A0A832N3P5_9GAMM|nr:flagellar biosynthesis protein FlhF [Candidatus Tenderia electrophaga]